MATYSETARELLGDNGGYGQAYGPNYGAGTPSDTIFDTATPLRIALPQTVEVADFVDAVTVSLVTNRTLLEQAEFADSATAQRVVTASVSEQAEFIDAATAAERVTIREVAEFVDSTATTLTTNQYVLEVAEFSDSVTAAKAETLTETAEFVDSTTATRQVFVSVFETAVADDHVDTPIQDNTVTVRAIGYGGDAASTSLLGDHLANEEFFITDSLYLDDEDGGYVWTALTTTWAMSRYVGTPFTSMLDDYATTNDELVRKDGGFGDADVLSGDFDLMSQDLKRVRALHMYGEHTSPLRVSVTADVKGLRNTSSYTQMARDASDVRAVRCTFGRGFKSQYYQIGAQSTGYARMRAWVPYVDSSRRRI